MIQRWPAATLAIAGLAVCGMGATAEAQAPLVGRARLEPRTVRVGEPARYRGMVIYRNSLPATLQWQPPDSSQWIVWGALRPSHRRGAAYDTLVIDAQVQAFLPGEIAVPGLSFVDRSQRSAGAQRLPTTRLRVTSVLTAADTNATLRPVRGPLAAPWWERVPWVWVLSALALIAAVVAFIVWRRRRRLVVPVVAPARPALVRRDPAGEALARLEALRARRLPEAGEFGLHALELTRILRQFLEATTGMLEPGDTTTELSVRLETVALEADERRQLIELMRGWDRVKFGRAPSTVADTRTSEKMVEAFVRRRLAPPSAPGPAPGSTPNPTRQKEAA